MRRIGWAGCLLAIGQLAGVAQVATAGDPAQVKAQAPADVERILGEWQKRMSSVTSIDAKFRSTSGPGTPFERKAEGRIVLAAPNLALLEVTPVPPDGKTSADRSRSIWTAREFLNFSYATERVARFRRSDDRIGPPVPLCVPFFFRMSVERARERYDWKVLGEFEDRIWLRATSRSDAPASMGPREYKIQLDKTSFLPCKALVVDRDGERETYEVLDIKLNAPIEDDLNDPCLDAWKVVEPIGWLTRWLPR